MINIIEDLSTLTTIPVKNIEKLFSKIIYCISDAIVEAKIQNKEIVDFDIGIGTLSIKLSENDIKYKFVPSAELQEAAKSAVLEEQNLLEHKVEQSFVDKIIKIYKELL